MLGSIPIADGYPTLINHTFKSHKWLVGKDIPLEKSAFLLIVLIIFAILFIHNKYDLKLQFKRLKESIKYIPYYMQKFKGFIKTLKFKFKNSKRKTFR